MTPQTAVQQAIYRTGLCQVGNHHLCRGTVAGIDCVCDCHTPAAPDPNVCDCGLLHAIHAIGVDCPCTCHPKLAPLPDPIELAGRLLDQVRRGDHALNTVLYEAAHYLCAAGARR